MPTWSSTAARLPGLVAPVNHKVIVVAPHPDDETLGVGGIIFDWIRAGIDVRILIVSDGAASHRHPDVVSIRMNEAFSASHALGAQGRTNFLHFPDAGLHSYENDIASAVTSFLSDDNGPCVLLGPRVDDGHSDHDAVAFALKQVATSRPKTLQWKYGVWTWVQPYDAKLLVSSFCWSMSAEARLAKAEAISRYASQVTGLLGEQIVTDQLLAAVDTGTEVVWC
jgi:LmbE family N-acetylglucosaminyl deacetylase